MLALNVHLGNVLTREWGVRGGGGQAIQADLSCLPPRISERMNNQQRFLHHLLKEYSVERVILFISVNLWCLRETLSLVTY